jgi:hypothetical protein
MSMSDQDLGGMTVNERLFVTGRLDAFNEAVAERDPTELHKILKSVRLDEASIRRIIGFVKDFGVPYDPT